MDRQHLRYCTVLDTLESVGRALHCTPTGSHMQLYRNNLAHYSLFTFIIVYKISSYYFLDLTLWYKCGYSILSTLIILTIPILEITSILINYHSCTISVVLAQSLTNLIVWGLVWFIIKNVLVSQTVGVFKFAISFRIDNMYILHPSMI